MLNLGDKSISYLIISSKNIGNISSYLYSKNYHIVEMKSYYNGEFENCIIAFPNSGNDETRRDAIHLLEVFNENSLNVKYMGDSLVKKISKNGSEKPLTLINYNTDSNLPSYILGAQSFSFIEANTYKNISKKEDLKNGMIVEYLNNEKWIPKKVENPEEEYEKFYKLLIKYGKVRAKN